MLSISLDGTHRFSYDYVNVTLEGVLTKERIGRALSNAELIDKAAGIINGLTHVKNLDEISHLPQKNYAQQAEMIVRYGAGCHMHNFRSLLYPGGLPMGICLQFVSAFLILVLWLKLK